MIIALQLQNLERLSRELQDQVASARDMLKLIVRTQERIDEELATIRAGMKPR